MFCSSSIYLAPVFGRIEDSALFELEQSLCCGACSLGLRFPAVQQPLQILSPIPPPHPHLCWDVLLQCQILWKASSGKCSRPVRSKPPCAAVEHVIWPVLPVHYFSPEREHVSVLFCPSLSGCLSTPWVSWHLVYFFAMSYKSPHRFHCLGFTLFSMLVLLYSVVFPTAASWHREGLDLECLSLFLYAGRLQASGRVSLLCCRISTACRRTCPSAPPHHSWKSCQTSIYSSSSSPMKSCLWE